MGVGTTELASPDETSLPPAIAQYVESLANFPELGSPQWQQVRDTESAFHRSIKPSQEAVDAYRGLWNQRYDSDLKKNLPAVITSVLDPDFDVAQSPAVFFDELVDPQQLRERLQQMVREGNVAALAFATNTLLNGIKAEKSQLHALRSQPMPFSDRLNLDPKEKRDARDAKWEAGTAVANALSAKFGVPLVAEGLAKKYPTLDDLAKVPTISQAPVQQIRIPGRAA